MIDRPDGPPDEPRQRWRIVFARDAAASGEPSSTAAEWESGLGSAGLPIARSLGKTPRSRLSFGPPLPSGVSGDAELADLVLTERLTVADVRARLAAHLPEGYRLVDVYDVWLGAPTVMAQVAAADYRVVVRGAATTEIARACDGLTNATSLERSRQKGDGRAVGYDLRPLLLGLSVEPASDQADAVPALTDTTLRMRLRLAQDGPAGRPDEVVLALGETIGHPLGLGSIARERLLTADMLEGA